MKRLLHILCLCAFSITNIPSASAFEIVVPYLSKRKKPQEDKNKNNQNSTGLIKGDKQTMLKKAQTHLDQETRGPRPTPFACCHRRRAGSQQYEMHRPLPFQTASRERTHLQSPPAES